MYTVVVVIKKSLEMLQ